MMSFYNLVINQQGSKFLFVLHSPLVRLRQSNSHLLRTI